MGKQKHDTGHKKRMARTGGEGKSRTAASKKRGKKKGGGKRT